MEKEKFEKLVDLISKQLELKNDFSKKFIDETLNAIIRFDNKHTEKGLGQYDKFGAFGIVVKLNDIYNDLVNHYNLQKPEEHDALHPEVLKKCWEDLSIFSLMALMIEKGEWNDRD